MNMTLRMTAIGLAVLSIGWQDTGSHNTTPPVPTKQLPQAQASEPRAVDAERVQLARQPLLAAVGLAPALDRGIEPVERKRQTLHRCIDRALVRHRRDPHSKTLAGAKI